MNKNHEDNRKVMMAMVEELRQKIRHAEMGGGEEARKRHLSRGKFLVRERIQKLIDSGTEFLEFSALAADGMYDGPLYTLPR